MYPRLRPLQRGQTKPFGQRCAVRCSPHRTSSPKRERNSLTVMMDFRFNRLDFFISDILSSFVRLFKLDIHQSIFWPGIKHTLAALQIFVLYCVRMCAMLHLYTWRERKPQTMSGTGSKRQWEISGQWPSGRCPYERAPVFESAANSVSRDKGIPVMRCMDAMRIVAFRSMFLTS